MAWIDSAAGGFARAVPHCTKAVVYFLVLVCACVHTVRTVTKYPVQYRKRVSWVNKVWAVQLGGVSDCLEESKIKP